MANWVFKGLSTGIVTTKYPARADEKLGSFWVTPVVAGGKCVPECNRCVEACYAGAIAKDARALTIDYAKCQFCSRCVEACPAGVIAYGLARIGTGNILKTTADRTKSLFRHSLHIRHVDAGACEACLSEIGMLATPYYDISRLGFFFTSSPRHADALMVSGPVTANMEEAVLKTYQAMPDPKLVIAVGACAGMSCPAKADYACRKRLDSLIPVDLYIAGCPASPLQIIHGLLTLVGREPKPAQKSV